MPLPKLTLADLARSGHITRWHSVRSTRNQTLAEHHYMVTRISNKLAKNIIGSKLTDTGLLQIMEYASLHDTPELLTGDLPSPLKTHINKICDDTDSENPIDQIEYEIAPWLTEMKRNMQQNNPEFLFIVKLADIIDALIFITVEGIGSHAVKVIQVLDEAFKNKLKQAAKAHPQYKWQYTVCLLNELLQNDEKSKIQFETT